MRLLAPAVLRKSRSPHGGFTLIEIMVVIAIALMVMGITIPNIIRKVHADSIQKAEGDFVDACREARTRAILGGITVELHIEPQTRQVSVVTVSEPPRAQPGSLESEDSLGIDIDSDEGLISEPSFGAPIFRRHLSDRIFIELLDVNFYEWKDADLARVRFFPNGTCDEFTIVLRSDANEWRKISLEVVTALSEVEVDPAKFAK